MQRLRVRRRLFNARRVCRSNAFSDEKPVSRDTQHRMMMESAPATAFVMPETELLFEVLIVALDAPAQLGEID